MDLWETPKLDVETHKPVILRSDDGAARAIAVRLPGGEQLQEHESHEHAYVLVADGEIELSNNGSSRRIATGGLAHFDPHERREITATEDSRLVMIFAPWPGEGHFT